MFGNLAEAASAFRASWKTPVSAFQRASIFANATENASLKLGGGSTIASNYAEMLNRIFSNSPGAQQRAARGEFRSKVKEFIGGRDRGASKMPKRTNPISGAKTPFIGPSISDNRLFGRELRSGVFGSEATSNMMKGMKMAALGGAMGFGTALLGSAVAPDLVSVDRPVSSIVKGALAGAALGALGGGAKSVQALNKGAAYGVPTFSKWTQSATNSPVTRGALFAATFAGSIDVGSSVQPYNRNRRA